MTWPLEPEGVRQFAEGLEEILVVEEKRALIENQLKEQLYNWKRERAPAGHRQVRRGARLDPALGRRADAGAIARVIAKRIAPLPHQRRAIEQRLAFLDAKEKALAGAQARRSSASPYFCSGCPHNTSTKVPEGSRALAGIGCHYMAQWMDRSTDDLHPDGRRGRDLDRPGAVHRDAARLPESRRRHLLPFRPAGDPRRGRRRRQHHLQDPLQRRRRHDRRPADGRAARRAADRPPARAPKACKRIAVVTDEPEKYPTGARLPAGRHGPSPRRARPGAARAARDPGRHASSSTTRPAPPRSAAGASAACIPIRPSASSSTSWSAKAAAIAACKSNCLSVMPVETEFGRKRAIDQSTCNKDFSCVKGFCPSFVTVHGGKLRKRKAARRERRRRCFAALPEPALPALDEPYGILVTGVGGTGVVTIGALLGMAAHLEGKGCTVLDMTGLAQKGGAVFSHVRIAADARRTSTPCASPPAAPSCCSAATWSWRASVDGAGQDRSRARRASVVNTHETITGDFTRKPDLEFPGADAAATDRATAPGADAHRLRRRHAHRHRAAGRLHRHQPVHARLRLSEGPGAGVGRGDRAGDRAERRRGRAEQAGLPLGPARRPSTARAVEAAGRRGRRREPPSAPARDDARRDRRAARRVPDRLSGRRLCRRATRRWSSACARAEAERAPGLHRPRRGGGALLLQAAGLQGRVRGRAALHRRQLPEAEIERSSRATTSSNSTWRRRCSPSAIPTPAI